MPFINLYDKATHSYWNSKKNGNFIYSVGAIQIGVVENNENPLVNLTTKESYNKRSEANHVASELAINALITKLDLNGNLIWEKTYQRKDGGSLYFEDIIFCDNSDIILLGVHDNNEGCSLFRLDSNGNEIWSRLIPQTTNQAGVVGKSNPKIIKVASNRYLVQIDEYFYINSTLQPETYIYLFDDNGDINKQQRVFDEHNKFKINSIECNEENGNIFFMGSTVSIQSNQEVISGIVLEFSSSLDLVNKYILKTGQTTNYNLEINSLFFKDNSFLIFGTYLENQRINFFTKVSLPVINSSTLIVKLISGPIFEACFFHSDFIYLQKRDRNNTIISKWDHDFKFIWNKNFDFGNFHDRLIREVSNNRILIADNFIGTTDLDLNSCLTTKADEISIGDKTFWISPDIDLSIINFIPYVKKNSLFISKIDSKKKEICPTIKEDEELIIKENSSIQSPNFYLQAAGSLGEDSTKGIHLRWIFSGKLGENHLPKGDYASTAFNFNKPNDYVKIYRASYQKVIFTLDLATIPTAVNDAQQYWLYKFNNDTRVFFVYFKNAAKYNQVRASFDPLEDPILFIKNYGDEVIEIENKRELFFSSSIIISDFNDSSTLQLEALSVAENKVFVPKTLSYRKTLQSYELSDINVFIENGRSVRYKPKQCLIFSIQFEFYSDFIIQNINNKSWTELGKYALTIDDNEAFTRLDPEPETNPVNGAWLRFNDNAFVNTHNYHNRWSGTVESWDRNIKNVVDQYITLSDSQDNPKAKQIIDINLANHQDAISVEVDSNSEIDSEGGMEVSNLDLLRIASYDYHIARMLGLGTLDLNELVFDGTFIYLGEYYTYNELEDGVNGEVHHLSMSLPTTLKTHRRPLAVDLKELKPGLSENDEATESNNLCDENGYSYDGKKRYINLIIEPVFEGEINPIFFSNSDFLDTSTFTLPVYAGLEYKKQLSDGVLPQNWEKPELSHKIQYLNIDSEFSGSYETIPLLLPEVESDPIYLHSQTISGKHFYSSYGINWFSRATESSIILDIITDLKPTNSLLPPSNLNPHLIQKEYPLMFTSQVEQSRLNTITNSDKTLIRLIFDYNSDHELINYQIPTESVLDDSYFVNDINSIYRDADEVIGDEIEVYFRDQTPKVINGKVIFDNNNNPKIVQNQTLSILADIYTTDYLQSSNGETLLSQFPPNTNSQNYIGGLFTVGTNKYIIHSINEDINGLIFTVYKKQITDGILNNDIPNIDAQNLELPTIDGDGLFSVVENMQNVYSWDTLVNPHGFKVLIGDGNWDIHREVIHVMNSNGTENRFLEKTRGIWELAQVEKVLENFTFEKENGELLNKINVHRGIYKITFDNFQLQNHPQTNSNGNSVEWFNGSVRLFTDSNFVNGVCYDSRKIFSVFRTENIGTSNNLVLYIKDVNFILNQDGNPDITNDNIVIGNGIEVNYYPSYKVYLDYNSTHHLTEEYILPEEGKGVKYSIFSLRTIDNNFVNQDGSFYKSKFSIPKMIYANELIEAEKPEQPLGGLFATRPDFFGKSSYTFTTKFIHKPYSISFYRSDSIALLSSIYSIDSMKAIVENLNELGGNNEDYFTNRWNNFLNFTELANEGNYQKFPPQSVSSNNYSFPLPDKHNFFNEINEFIVYHNQNYNDTVALIQEIEFGNLPLNHVVIDSVNGQNQAILLIDFVKEAIMNTFIPLTEIPILYKFVHDESDYKPTNKKQKIRDRNGYLIDPNSNNAEFDMAPMMKIVDGANYKTQFTDFTLDGTTNSAYFYAAKEISSQMKMGDFSDVLGPIKLVNSNPPEPPKIMSVLPVLENKLLGIQPKIKFEIAAYPEVQQIKKINLYRSFNRLNAESVQSMDLIKVIDIDSTLSSDIASWNIEDTFDGLENIPYSETIFYRITVCRKVEYADSEQNVVVEFAPSLASKLMATMVVESYSPDSPKLNYSAGEYNPNDDNELQFITFNWEQNVYKGNYFLYKMNSQGNWTEIIRVISDRSTNGLYHIYNQDAQGNWVNSIHPEPLMTFNDKIYLPLELTNLATTSLITRNEENEPLYHHFKVIAQNTSGMSSKQEYILTLYNSESYNSDFGIGSNDNEGMNIQGNFVVRPN